MVKIASAPDLAKQRRKLDSGRRKGPGALRRRAAMKTPTSPLSPEALCECLHLTAQHLDSIRDFLLCLVARVESEQKIGRKPKESARALKLVNVGKPLASKPAVNRTRVNPNRTR